MSLTVSHYRSYLVLLTAITLSYLPSFSGGFLLDDRSIIENNPSIQTAQTLISYFRQEDGIVSGESWENSHTGYYRPLVSLIHRLDFLVWGMNPKGFRLTNIVLHLLVCLLLFHVVLLMIGDRTAALWAACLFAVHPTNTEAVSWISSRNNLLVMLFSLGCLYAFLKYGEQGNPLMLISSILFFTLAVFSKEFGLMLLPCLVIHRLLRLDTKRSNSGLFSVFLPFFLVVLLYFFLRKNVTGSWITPTDSGDMFQRLYFIPYLLLWNLRLIFLPFNLHNFIIHYPPGFLHWQIITGYLCIAGLGTFAWKMRMNRRVQFAALSFLISLVPVLNIFQSSAVSLVAMRWLYFPMIFMAILIGFLIQKALKFRSSLSEVILLVLIIYMGTYSYMLNRYLWHDEKAFYSFEVYQFSNPYYYGGLAGIHADAGDRSGAETYYKLAIEHRLKNPTNYINYAALLMETDRAAAAQDLLEKAANLPMSKKQRVEWLNNLSTAHFRQGDYSRALDHIRRAVALDPDKMYLWKNLASAYALAGDYPNAIRSVGNGLTRWPHSVILKKTLAIVYMRMEAFEKALALLKTIPKEKWQTYGIDHLHNDTQRRLKLE